MGCEDPNVDCGQFPTCPQCDPHGPPGGGGLVSLTRPYDRKEVWLGDHGQFLPWESNTTVAAIVVAINKDGTVNLLVEWPNGSRWVDTNILVQTSPVQWDEYIAARKVYLKYKSQAWAAAITAFRALGHQLLRPMFLDGRIHLVQAAIDVAATVVWDNGDGTVNCLGYFGDHAGISFFPRVSKTIMEDLLVWKAARAAWLAIREPLFADARRKIEEYRGNTYA